MVNESLQWWVDVCMSEHSVGAEWQVENQQVITEQPFLTKKLGQKLNKKICVT